MDSTGEKSSNVGPLIFIIHILLCVGDLVNGVDLVAVIGGRSPALHLPGGSLNLYTCNTNRYFDL